MLTGTAYEVGVFFILRLRLIVLGAYHLGRFVAHSSRPARVSSIATEATAATDRALQQARSESMYHQRAFSARQRPAMLALGEEN